MAIIDINIIFEISIRVLCGLISSIIFLIIIFSLRPKIKIAPEICKTLDKDSNTFKYFIKIINSSKFFKVIDINAELTRMIPSPSPKCKENSDKKKVGGNNLRLQKLILKHNHVWYLTKKSKKSEHATYAYIFMVTENVEQTWENDKGDFLHFKIVARHGFSGFPKVITRHYIDKGSCIIEGRYAFGNTFDIIKN